MRLLRGTRLVRLYVGVITLGMFVLTIIQPGGPL